MSTLVAVTQANRERQLLSQEIFANSPLYWPQAEKLARVLLESRWCSVHDQALREEIAVSIEECVSLQQSLAQTRIERLLFTAAKGALLTAASLARRGRATQ